MDIIRYLRSGFSAQLSLWVTGFVTAIFVVALALLFRFSQDVVKDESLEHNMQVLEQAALRVDRLLHQTETTAATVSWIIRHHLSSPTIVAGLCHEVMQANPWIDSCYVIPVSQSPVSMAGWREKELDAVADSVPLKPMVLTYYLPVQNARGEHCLTLTVDVQMDWAEINTAVTKQIPYAQCFLQGVGGHYLLEESGWHLEDDGKDTYHFYRPFSHSVWGLAMLCPEHGFMGGFNRLLMIGVFWTVAALLLLLLICRIVIDRNIKPLDLLSVKVRRIAHNQFDEPIPTSSRQDEIGELQRGFSTMQQALASHLDEMHRKTETLKQQNEALKAAYERGRKDERTKTAFLSRISEQIMMPVNKILVAADRLDGRYQNFTKEEMSRLQHHISANTETITSLIDQMLLNSQRATDAGNSNEPEMPEP